MIKHFVLGSMLAFGVVSCGSVNSAQSIQNRTQAIKVTDFKYVYIAPAKGLAMDPTPIIKEWAAKKGLKLVTQLGNATNPETIIINFGAISKQIPGRPKVPFEVKIQFVSAKNYVEVTTCRSFGTGTTEAAEIESAVYQCLEKIN